MPTISPHFRKICLAHFPTKTHVCAKFCDHWSKTEEGVRSTRFSLYFSRNVPLPWQPFPHISEKYVLHIFPPRPMCVPSFVTIGQKLRKEFAPQGFATDRPPDRPTARPPDRRLIPIYPLQTSFGGGIIIIHVLGSHLNTNLLNDIYKRL